MRDLFQAYRTFFGKGDALYQIIANKDLIDLNRSIQETVSLTIYDYPHLINFTDRIYFKGNAYFLISNSALSSHNIFCQQSIVMRRWF